jgi:mono/diheme cytochrome c family protein
MKTLLRRIAIAVFGLVVVVLLAAGAGFGVSNSRINKSYSVQVPAIAIPTDSASVERGRHIAFALAKCVECHGENLAGNTFIDGPPVGTLYADNLTRGKGGIGATYTDADWLRTLKHGVRPDGKSVIFMPAQEYASFSDADLGALIAYIKQVPPVDKVHGEQRVGPVFRALHLAGQLPLLPAELIDHAAVGSKTAPPAGVTLEYGEYLTNISGCKGCHGATLSGGPIAGAPPEWKPAANITPTGIGHYTEETFFRALREGRRPDMSPIDSVMPFKYTKLMTDDEIKAVYGYLKTVPGKPFGNH